MLVKLEDAAKSRHEILLGRTVAHRFCQLLERAKHVWQALLQHCQEQFQTPLKMNIQGPLRAACFMRDLPCGDARKAVRLHELLCCPQYLRTTIKLSDLLGFTRHDPPLFLVNLFIDCGVSAMYCT